MKILGSPMRTLGSPIKRQVGSPMKWGLLWVSDDDDFFPADSKRTIIENNGQRVLCFNLKSLYVNRYSTCTNIVAGTHYIYTSYKAFLMNRICFID